MSQIIKPSGGTTPPTPFLETLSDNVNTKVNADVTGNIQIEGQLNEQIGFFSTVVAATPAPSSSELTTNPMSPARWIVDGLSTTANPNGTHTTIAAAIAAAFSGDTILILPKGSPYVENLTLKAGVNLVGMGGDAYDSNVAILGNTTYSSGGSVVISNIALQTNNDFCLTVSGSSASRLVLKDCVISCLNHTGISFTTVNSAALIFAEGCFGTVNINSATLYSQTSPGTLLFEFCSFSNTVSSVSSSNSAGIASWQNSIGNIVLNCSGSGEIFIDNSEIDTSALNATSVTTTGTGASNIYNSYIASGTASALNIGIGSSILAGSSVINSTNTNAITGTGTISLQGITLAQSSGINTTTISGKSFAAGTFEALNGTTALPSYSFVNNLSSGLRTDGTNVFMSVGNNDTIEFEHLNTTFAWLANFTTVAYGNNFQSTSAATFTANVNNSLYIACDPTSNAITIKLPDVASSGQIFIIKDSTGQSNTNNITVTTVSGSKTFDGSTTSTINVAYGSLSVIYNPSTTNYEIF